MSTPTSSVLKSLLAGKTLALKSSGGGHGVSYTDQEHALARALLIPLLAEVNIATKAGTEPGKKDIEAVLVTIMGTIPEGERSVAGCARKAFRHLTGEHIAAKTAGYPKLRDPTSIQLIFRAALVKLEVAEDKINLMFPRYGASEKKGGKSA